LILVVTYGGNAWGMTLAVWPTALQSIQPALVVSLFGIVIMPIISAAAAWIPVRTVLKHNPIETLALQ